MEVSIFELFKTAATILCSGFAVYHAIKLDIAVHHEQIKSLRADLNDMKSVINQRIDDVLTRGQQ
jgi:cell division protein FtsB